MFLPVSVGPNENFPPYVYSRTCKACGIVNSVVASNGIPPQKGRTSAGEGWPCIPWYVVETSNLM